ncbi:hypothetical protein [Clostridium cylindrosporum]|nr:hypothetical protein [Clostridium cylindrosporum]
MEIKCPTCGYLAKDTVVCPRCRANLACSAACSGNCLSCSSSKVKNKK